MEVPEPTTGISVDRAVGVGVGSAWPPTPTGDAVGVFVRVTCGMVVSVSVREAIASDVSWFSGSCVSEPVAVAEGVLLGVPGPGVPVESPATVPAGVCVAVDAPCSVGDAVS